MFTSSSKREIRTVVLAIDKTRPVAVAVVVANIHIQILQTININRFSLRISRENLVKGQNIFSLVINFLILIIFY